MSASKQSIRTGTLTSCPIGPLLGHDGDECRATAVSKKPSPTADGIACITCQCVWPLMPKRLNSIIAAILNSGFRNPRVETGSQIQEPTQSDSDGSQDSLSEYAAACLSGYDPATFDIVRMSFDGAKGAVGERVELQYFSSTADYIEEPELDHGRQLNTDELSALPRNLSATANLLYELGCRVSSVSVNILPDNFIVFHCGRKAGKTGTIIGVTVRLIWCEQKLS